MASQPRIPLGRISGNRQLNTQLSPASRNRIYGALDCGVSSAYIADTLNLPSSTIRIQKFRRSERPENGTTKPRSGRPKKLDDRDERRLLRAIRKEPKIEWEQLQKELNLNVHKTTLWRRLVTHGINKWLAMKRPKLTEEVAAKRLQFALDNINREPADWARFIFSDECSIEISKGKKRTWVFRTPSQKWDKEMIDPYPKGHQLSLMVWGAIDLPNSKLALVFMERDSESKRNGYSARSYVDTLEAGLLPVSCDESLFVQDNAPIHKSLLATEWLAENGIVVIVWPPYSPDLNPIENIWAKLKEILHQRHPDLLEMKGRGELQKEHLKTCILDAWNHLPTDYIDSCINSMPKRLQAVIDAKGWHTKY